jgi:hypothetical protein
VNILDENIVADQVKILRKWGIPLRQISYDVGYKGLQDTDIIPVLHHLHQPTFFTRDLDFYKRELCHARYCLVYLSVLQIEVAKYVRRVLRHPAFNTAAKRMGTIIRAAPTGLTVWRLYADQESAVAWPE